jgi:protein involved in polysaccharide export with SLBB domain
MKQMLFAALAILHLVVAALASAQSTGTPAEAITLRPGDVVRVAIWREEDLSGEFPVDENGTVVFPLLGEKPVTGIPFPALRTALMDEYRIHLRNPSITITPLRRVNVLGEVNKPGLYEVDPTISLAGVVALAGGTNPGGDLGRIRIVRSGAVLHERVSATSSLHDFDVRSGDQIFVDRRGWFDRNSTFVVSVLLSITSLAISLMR